MPRRKRGRPLDGWLIVDKPLGVGSTDIVAKARWALQAQKAGHAGTLDPLATGLLAVAFGEATKTVAHAMNGLKTYHFTAKWGSATTTDDLEGETIARSERRPSPAEITALLPSFTGEVLQRPPIYSAIKVDGARAYDLARSGDAPELAPRPILIKSLNLLGADGDTALFEMRCGKGGYVRALARDLGDALGCFAHVTTLRRIKAGPFDISDAISFELLNEFRHRDGSESALLPVAAGLDDIPAVAVSRDQADLLRQGRRLRLTGAIADADFPKDGTVWASLSGAPVAICVREENELRPNRVFNLAAPRSVELRACTGTDEEKDKDDDVDHDRTQASVD